MRIEDGAEHARLSFGWRKARNSGVSGDRRAGW
jgi:hypothetical protein